MLHTLNNKKMLNAKPAIVVLLLMRRMHFNHDCALPPLLRGIMNSIEFSEKRCQEIMLAKMQQ